MGLQLSLALLQQMIAHADRSYPEECCGLLLGTIESSPAPQAEQERKTACEIWETPNAWSEEVAEAIDALTSEAVDHSEEEHNRRDRYWIDPQEMLKAQKYARDRHLEVIGIYHSHPDHVAIPSECDRRLAWARYSYLIFSVQQGKMQDYRVWSLDENHQFQPEPLWMQ